MINVADASASVARLFGVLSGDGDPDSENASRLRFH
jgi:hypothetical protein